MTQRTSEERSRFPMVLLLCDSNPFSIVRYLEHSLYYAVNLIVVHLDVHEWFLKRFGLSQLFYKLLKLRLKHLSALPRDPDLIVVVDPTVKTHLDLSPFANSVKSFYALDPHSLGARESYRKCRVCDYDYVFSGQKDYIPMLRELGCRRVHWLPYAVDPTVFRELKNVRVRYDVAFIAGLSPERRQIVEPLMKKFRFLTKGYGRGGYFMHDNSIAYSMSKMVLQISNRGTLGPRIFEGMACNRLVIADKIRNGLDDLTKNGTDIVLYRDLSELEHKIKYYLDNEEEMRRIALRGYQLVINKHTYNHRVNELLMLTLK